MGGTLLLSGLYKTGKTTFALHADNPDLIAFFDFDYKGRNRAVQAGVWRYRNPDETTREEGALNYDSGALLRWFKSDLGELYKEVQEHPITTVILDNATFLVDAFEYQVKMDPARYGVKAANIAGSKYGGANPGIRKIWTGLVEWLQNQLGAKLVIIINHMGQPWTANGPIPNRWYIYGGKAFHQIALLALIMEQGDPKRGGKPPIPSALVAGEGIPGEKYDDELGEWTTERLLPARLPIADWKHVNAYLDGGKAKFNPAPVEERWSAKEAAAYGSWLTEKQLEFVQNGTVYGDDQDSVPNGATAETVEKAFAEQLVTIRELAGKVEPDTKTDAEVNALLKRAGFTSLDKLNYERACAVIERMHKALHTQNNADVTPVTPEPPPAKEEPAPKSTPAPKPEPEGKQEEAPKPEPEGKHWSQDPGQVKEFVKWTTSIGHSGSKKALALCHELFPDSEFAAMPDLPPIEDIKAAYEKRDPIQPSILDELPM
jgi:hypothetical protein